MQGHSLDWEAAGNQLLEEEQQAAAKAAAKKAKKLRQKLNKQPTPGTYQGHIAAQDSFGQHKPDAEAPAVGIDTSHPVPLPTEHSKNPAAPVPLHSQSTNAFSGQASCLQPSQPVDSVVTALSPGSTPAVSTAHKGLPPSALDNNVAGYKADAREEPLDQQPSAGSSASSEVADNDMFLQDLFTCPLTKVSGYCNNMTFCCTFL